MSGEGGNRLNPVQGMVSNATAGPVPGQDALAFLARHGLPPTPQNYTLAYIALNEPASPIGRAVHALADDGFRIRQEEADEIIGIHDAEAAGTAPDPAEQVESPEHEALRHQTIKLGEMASSAAAASEAFARELSSEAQALEGDAARTVQVVARMIERSKSTESQFSAAAEEVAALREMLEAARDDARRDALTGLGNRRAIDLHLQQLADAGSPRIVGMCDIDNFKAINDRYGHGVGDRVLKLVAAALADACRPHFVGRWGGEEFLVVMEGDDIGTGLEILNRARIDLARRDFKLRETDERMDTITFSGGVALAEGDHADSISAIHRADAALYRSKASGRNQVLPA